MNSMLIASFCLAVVASVVLAADPADVEYYFPILKAYCDGRFGPNGEKYMKCYKDSLKTYPSVYDDTALINVCVGTTHTDAQVKEKCDTLQPDQEKSKNAFVICAIDVIAARCKEAKDTCKSVKDAIGKGGAPRVDTCK